MKKKTFILLLYTFLKQRGSNWETQQHLHIPSSQSPPVLYLFSTFSTLSLSLHRVFSSLPQILKQQHHNSHIHIFQARTKMGFSFLSKPTPCILFFFLLSFTSTGSLHHTLFLFFFFFFFFFFIFFFFLFFF